MYRASFIYFLLQPTNTQLIPYRYIYITTASLCNLYCHMFRHFVKSSPDSLQPQTQTQTDCTRDCNTDKTLFYFIVKNDNILTFK